MSIDTFPENSFGHTLGAPLEQVFWSPPASNSEVDLKINFSDHFQIDPEATGAQFRFSPVGPSRNGEYSAIIKTHGAEYHLASRNFIISPELGVLVLKGEDISDVDILKGLKLGGKDVSIEIYSDGNLQKSSTFNLGYTVENIKLFKYAREAIDRADPKFCGFVAS